MFGIVNAHPDVAHWLKVPSFSAALAYEAFVIIRSRDISHPVLMGIAPL